MPVPFCTGRLPWRPFADLKARHKALASSQTAVDRYFLEVDSFLLLFRIHASARILRQAAGSRWAFVEDGWKLTDELGQNRRAAMFCRIVCGYL